MSRNLGTTLLIVIALHVIGLTLVDVADASAADKANIDFRQQIQPLLARDCFACHGPDGNTREADLRLDLEAAAKEHVLIPGDVDSSELVSRIFSDDAELQMPPPETGHRLSDDERERIRLWVEQGADWQSHWAFELIVAIDPPSIFGDSEVSPIDRLVATRRQQEGLAASPRADQKTLLRRVYFDLIGLPPSLEQIKRFVDDNRPNAYELAIDELLQSSHYGEQMAVAWMDAARYADTNGYQNDFNRSMWPWRDWVIDAFNTNLPYDEFVIEQIAGDMLPDATDRQLIATGFNRNNRSVTEGGSIEAEWRVENCVDRVETTAGTFLGLTMGCARCHDHKYDPISQKEFYQFFAFFNNVDEQGVYNEQRGNAGSQLAVATTEQRKKLAELSGQIAALDPAELAAMTSVAAILLNLDEVLTKE